MHSSGLFCQFASMCVKCCVLSSLVGAASLFFYSYPVIFSSSFIVVFAFCRLILSVKFSQAQLWHSVVISDCTCYHFSGRDVTSYYADNRMLYRAVFVSAWLKFLHFSLNFDCFRKCQRVRQYNKMQVHVVAGSSNNTVTIIALCQRYSCSGCAFNFFLLMAHSIRKDIGGGPKLIIIY